MENKTTTATPVPSAEAQEGGQPYLDIIARLEAATEGGRELDAAIFRLIGLTDRQERHCRDWCRMDGRTDLTRDRYIDAWAKDYTTSIDAAMTLLPEGWDWKIISRAHSPYQGRWPFEAVADRGDLRIPIHKRMIAGFAMTAALALCIACLSAKASPATVASDNGTPPKTDEIKGGTKGGTP